MDHMRFNPDQRVSSSHAPFDVRARATTAPANGRQATSTAPVGRATSPVPSGRAFQATATPANGRQATPAAPGAGYARAQAAPAPVDCPGQVIRPAQSTHLATTPRVSPVVEPAAPQHQAKPKMHVAAIDGLRSLAILSVLLYHLNVPWLPSGHMGVVMFLVLTGYLITSSLLRGFQRDGSVSWGAFAVKRVKRLLPSIAFMVVVVAVLCTAFNHVLLTKMRPDIIPALLFFENLNYIFNGASYFEAIGSPSPLTHLWYVGLDLQICLIWAAVVIVGLKHGASVGNLRWVALGLAAVSAILMAVFYVPMADPSRVYYGTDTRLFSVMLGAWLALAWPLGFAPALEWIRTRVLGMVPAREGRPGEPARFCNPQATQLINVLGVASLALIVLIMVIVPPASAFFYRGGMLLVSLLVVILMMAILAPGSWISTAFGVKPLQWLGSRSFGLYLWHYPIIDLLDCWHGPIWLQLLAIVLSLGAAELSYRIVEKPMTSGAVLEGFRSLLDRTRTVSRLTLASAAGGIMLVGVALLGCILVPETTLVPKDAIVSTGEAVDAASDLRAKVDSGTGGTGSGGATPVVDGAGTDGAIDLAGTSETAETAQVASSEPVANTNPIPDGPLMIAAPWSVQCDPYVFEPFLIGDSVPGDTNFYQVFPHGYNDSVIGRQPFQAVSVYKQYQDQGVVGNIVVYASFSNSCPRYEDMEKLVIDIAGAKEVFLVATYNPDGFMDAANSTLRTYADYYDNVHYVDWPAAVAGHESEYLWGDKTHLTPTGADAYLQVIARAIAPYIQAEGGAAVPLE